MRYTIIYIVALLAGSAKLYAQEPLSLGDAVAIGLQQNFDIRVERQNVAIATNNNNWGEAGRYPSLTLNISQNNSINDNVKTASPFAIQGQIFSNSVAPSVALNWTLFDGFRISMTKKRLEQLEAESAGNASIVIANALQSIVLGYYLASLEQDRLEEFAKQLHLSRDKYRYIEAGAELGTAGTSDMLLEEGNYLTDSLSFVNQQLAFRNALRNLNFILGEKDVNKTYTLTDRLGEEFPEFELADLHEKMLDGNVDLKKQYITQSLLGTNVKLARADRYPSLALNAGLTSSMGLSDLSRTSIGDAQRAALRSNPDTVFVPNYLEPLSSTTNTYFANFTLSFNLFNGGKINRAIKNSIIQEDIGNIRIESMRTSLERDLQEAFDRYQIRRQIYGINKRREEAAAVNLDITSEKFKNGTINSFDYRVVQNNHLSASIVRLQSLYDLMDSKVELMRLTGGLIETYNQ